MALNLAGLSTYTDQRNQEIKTEAVIGANTIQKVTLMPDVKYISKLHYLLNDSIVLQAGGCGFSASGETSLDDRDVTVYSTKINEEVCPETLTQYWLNQSMRPGYNTTLPFETQYVDFKVKKVQEAIENNIWSSTASSSTKPAGWLYQFDNDSVVNDVIYNITGTTLVASDWLAMIYGAQNALPEAIQGATDLVAFVGFPIFRKIVQSLVIANLYHVDLTGNNGMQDFIFPGTNITVSAVHGLDTKSVIVLTPASNLVYATDIVSDNGVQFKIWWSDESQVVKFVATWKYGVSYFFSDYVAYVHI